MKAGIVVTFEHGFMVGACTFLGNPFDGHLLREQLEQTGILLESVGQTPKEAVVDLAFRGVDADNRGVTLIHRGKAKSLTRQHRRCLKRRQAVELAIDHLKADHLMDRRWLRVHSGEHCTRRSVAWHATCARFCGRWWGPDQAAFFPPTSRYQAAIGDSHREAGCDHAGLARLTRLSNALTAVRWHRVKLPGPCSMTNFAGPTRYALHLAIPRS